MALYRIGIFGSNEDIQEALDNGRLGNPYVAYITDDDRIDFNSLEPTPQAEYIGHWEMDGSKYIFIIDNPDPELWADGVEIAVIPNAYYEQNEGEVSVTLKNESNWTVTFDTELLSSPEELTFYDSEDLQTTTQISLNSSDESNTSYINVWFDGEAIFSFSSNGDVDLEMDTIDPEEGADNADPGDDL